MNFKGEADLELESQGFKCQMNEKELFVKGIKDCIPTIFGYLSIGIACGILCKSCNITFSQAVGMSIFIYAGSAQFISAGMMFSGLPAISIICTIFFVNLRHIFMSASMAPYFKKNSLIKNLLIGTLLTDETFLVASTEGIKNKKIDYWWMMGLNIAAYLNWIIATGIGVLIGNLIPDYKQFGLDFALTAMFVGLLISSIENIKLKKSIIIILTSVIILILSTKFVSTSLGVIIAAIFGALVGIFIKD
ncbi:MAG: AzlC family ABC transporter permease [Clostridium butyricum]|nr:AzlC family ABC transporter permease [Clostridium butyricum]